MLQLIQFIEAIAQGQLIISLNGLAQSQANGKKPLGMESQFLGQMELVQKVMKV